MLRFDPNTSIAFHLLRPHGPSGRRTPASADGGGEVLEQVQAALVQVAAASEQDG